MKKNEPLMFASNNQHKANELALLLGIHLTMPKDFTVEETGDSFLANALLKARQCYKQYGCPVIADDSGLVVDALPNDLGVRTARFGGQGLKQAQRNSLLLEKMQGITNRKAKFVCTLVFYQGDNDYIVVEQKVEGEIGLKEEGEDGFGYDPLFYLPWLGKTMACLTKDEKNNLSHRGKAARLLKEMILD